MTKSRIAEWILSQVLPPDRAASTVGDWMEDAPERGNIWFWSCVFCTLVSSIRCEISEDLLVMLGLALRGYLFLISLVLLIGLAILPFAIFGATRHILLSLPEPHGIFRILNWTWTASYGQLMGRWVSRRAPGKEIATCLTSCFTSLILVMLAACLLAQFGGVDINRFTAGAGGPSFLTQSALFDLGLLSQAILERGKYIRSIAE